jgi:NAD(P)H-flavin reductase
MRIPDFSSYAPATLLAVREAAAEQAFLDIEPPPFFVDAYARPGQFCKIRVENDEGIFAMFSAPSETGARFLIRIGNPIGGEAADRLVAMADGSPIEMTLPAGDGFPLDAARGRNVFFVATGTGIAPVRAAIEMILRDRASYGFLSLDHGVRSAGHLAIASDIERWRRLGVHVHVHFSHPTDDGVRGVTVQAALRDRRPDLHNAAIVAVGQPEMLEGLLEEVVALGGDPELFLKNV